MPDEAELEREIHRWFDAVKAAVVELAEDEDSFVLARAGDDDVVYGSRRGSVTLCFADPEGVCRLHDKVPYAGAIGIARSGTFSQQEETFHVSLNNTTLSTLAK